MDNNNNFFDEKIKEKLKQENRYIPQYANDAFDKGIKIGMNRRRYKYKRLAGITAACFLGITIFTVTLPAYADKVPLLNNIVDYFNSSRYENYDEYASDLNITKESKGVKVTINKVVYDGLDLAVFYTVESEGGISNMPHFIDSNLKVNGKKISFSSSSSGEFLEGNKAYVGHITYDMDGRKEIPKEVQEESFYGGYVEIPDEFLFSLEFSNIEGILDDGYVRGNWSFDIPVTNEAVNGKVKEYEQDIKLTNINDGVNINKIITTPINTAIQGTYYGSEFSNIDFIAFDNEGRYMEPKSGTGFGTTLKDNKFINYFTSKFKEVYEDTKSITFIPYKYKEVSDVNIRGNGDNKVIEIGDIKIDTTESVEGGYNDIFKLTVGLNLEGKTNLTTILNNEYGNITKVEVNEGKTKLYIKSNYNVFAVPELIRDKSSGEEIKTVDNFNSMELDTTRYLKDSGELVVEYDGELTGDDYEVIYYDHSNSMNVYGNDMFEVDVK